MVKIRIVHKGLILVAVPLVFGIGFTSLLLYGLAETNRIIKRELMLKDAMISHISSIRCSSAAKICAMSYLTNKDPFYKKQYIANKETAQQSYRHLKKLLRKEPKLIIPDSPMTSGQQFLMSGGPNQRASGPFLSELQLRHDRASSAAKQAMASLRFTLIAGVIASFVIAGLLVLYFFMNIRNRLLIIMNNMVNLGKGTALSPPLKGNDEISELDQFLFKSAMEIRELESFKKEMIGMVSQELRNPLSTLGSFLFNLGDGVFGQLGEKARIKAERTNASVKRLMELVKELLFLDRLELELRPEEFSIDELISASVDAVKELSEQSGIEIVVKNEGEKIIADRNRILQVIVNLVSNAMKFSPQNGTVTIESLARDGSFECRVSDQGKGIPEAFRKQIFEPFRQVDSSDARTKKGTGLGLTISRSIIEQHGGSIGVDSIEGRGSTFWFMIPGTASATAKKRESSRPSFGHSSGSGKFKVLQQGLVIISVPLVFQLAFASLIGSLLYQVQEQTRQEEISLEILDSLNRMTEEAIQAASLGMVFAYTKDPVFLESWLKGKQAALLMLEHAASLSASNAENKKDISQTKAAIEEIDLVLKSEASKSDSSTAGLRNMLEMGGMDGMMGVMSGMMRSESDKKLSTNSSPNSSTTEKASAIIEESAMKRTMNAVQSAGATHGDGSMLGVVKSMMGSMTSGMGGKEGLGGGMGALGMMGKMKSLFGDSIQVKMVRPFLKAEEAQDRLMFREKAIGEKFAAERTKTMQIAQIALNAAIPLNTILSVLLAVFLLRNLTGRLQHVVENTSRLVKRETLDPPKAGGDEIAFLDQMLLESAKHLIELEVFKQELISIVSHELRTPLLSISSALELFEIGALGELTEEGKSSLNFAQVEANRLISLINDLLDIEKMEAGKFVLDISELNTASLLENAKSAVMEFSEAKQITIESNASDIRFWADQDRICQVLTNFLSNAIKFSPTASTVKITVELVPCNKILSDNEVLEDWLVFKVIDQGKGVAEELQEKIFDRFVQAESNASDRAGTGLGLAIAKAIVEQHGGSIGVESEPDQGSTFWFKIPVSISMPGSTDAEKP